MARGYFLQNSFLEGEWSPLFQGKADEERYYRAANLLLNYIPTDEGAAVRRSGSRFSAHAKNNTGQIRLIPFISETGEALACELTSGLSRFHRRGTLFTEQEVAVTEITAATPAAVTTASNHGWSTGNSVVFKAANAVLGQPIRNKQYVITVTGDNTFTLDGTDGTELNGLLAIGGIQVERIVERVLPYTGAQLRDVRFTEEANRLYLFHAGHKIRTFDHEATAFTVNERDLSDGPYLPLNETATTLSFSGVSGSITVTASAATGINDDQGFLTTDIGRLIRVNTGTETEPSWSWLEITARATNLSVTATVRGADLESTAAVTTWRLGLYSDTTGWPKAGVIHEGRLWLIGGAAGRVDGSKTGSPFDFSPTEPDGTVADNNAVTAVFSGSGRQNPQGLAATESGLFVGANGGEYIIRASSFDDPITPFTIQARKHTEYGSSSVQPLRAGRNVVFVQELGRSVFEYRDTGNGAYDGNDFSRQGRHLTADGIIETAYQKLPNPAVWCLRGDGRLIGCTYRDDLEGRQVAWHRHSLQFADDVAAGEDADERYLRGGGSQSAGEIFSISTVPFSDPEASRNDNLWIAIDRGGIVSVEYLSPLFDVSFFPNEAIFVDSANVYFVGDENFSWEILSQAGGNVTVRFHGLDRLNGKTVDGQWRGFDIGSATVSTGFADFTFDEDLLTAAAAFETVSDFQFAAGGLTFNSAFISEYHVTSPSEVQANNPQSTIITGEDGVDYYISLPNPLHLRRASDAVLVDTVDTTRALSDANGAGITPPNVDQIVASSFNWFTIPETPYVVGIVGGADGSSSSKRILYYKINSSGLLEIVGGYAGATDGLFGTQFSPGFFVAQGHIIDGGFPGANETIAFKYPTVVAYFGEDDSTLLAIPSINEIIASTPMIENNSDHWDAKEIELTAATFGDNIFNITASAPGSENSSRGFFLPSVGEHGGVFLQMFYTADLEDHADGLGPNAYLNTHAPTFTTGLISQLTVFLGQKNPDNGNNPFLWNLTIGGVTVAKHVDFFQADGSTAAFPFPDDKLDFAGNPGSAVDNYYGNPSVYPSDANDPEKPWFIFFPRFFREAGDTDKFGIRVFEWNPHFQRARELDFAKGQMFTLGTDVDGNTILKTANIKWDRATGNIDVLMHSHPLGEENLIVARFGTFIPSNETSVGFQHINAVIGCNYKSRTQLLRPDAGAGGQVGQGAIGKTRRIDQYGMLTFRAGPLNIGTDFDSLFEIQYPNPITLDSFGRRPLQSAVAHGSLDAGYDFDNMILWEQDRPVPGAIVSVAGFSKTQDR